MMLLMMTTTETCIVILLNIYYKSIHLVRVGVVGNKQKLLQIGLKFTHVHPAICQFYLQIFVCLVLHPKAGFNFLATPRRKQRAAYLHPELKPVVKVNHWV